MRRTIRTVLAGVLAALVPACGTGGGNGTFSPTVAPAAPAGVVPLSGNGQVTLSWAPSAAAGSYSVRRSTNPAGPFLPLPSSPVTSPAFVDSGLVNGTSYYYVVTASNAFGESLPSAVVGAAPGMVVARVAGGAAHAMALLVDGTFWAWGSNQLGQLGIGSPRESSTVAVRVPLDGIVGMWGGGVFSLALRSDGTAFAWGSNEYGQLGDPSFPTGTNAESRSPIPVPGLSGIVSMSAGIHYTLALLSDGTVWGWGRNSDGQAGPPPGLNVTTPTQVPGLPPAIVAVSAGSEHALALAADGTVWSWGTNNWGQLGNGSSGSAWRAPAQVSNLTQVVRISTKGIHNLAVRSDGTAWAWGFNTGGQCGIGPVPTTVTTPTRITALAGVMEVAATNSSSLAVLSNGSVWAWGRNDLGELARPQSLVTSDTPLEVAGIPDVRAVAGGSRTAYALQQDGTLFSWGDGAFGQLGGGSGGIQDAPVQVANVTSAAACAAGGFHTLAVRADGTALAWGAGDAGKLGTGSTLDSPFRVPVAFSPPLPVGTTVTSVSAGTNHSVARLSNGTVWAWGISVANGQAVDASTPVQVSTPAGITAISSGSYHNLALVGAAGTVWFWGRNDLGQRGNGTSGGQVLSPVQVTGVSGITAVAAGFTHCLALKSDGTVWGWGYNAQSQVGVPGPSPVLSPVQVPGLTGAVAISAGHNHSMAIRSDGSVWTWGGNGSGQLGRGSAPQPGQVPGLTGVARISAGLEHCLAVDGSGTLYAWGVNTTAQLGSNLVDASSVPIVVPGILSPTMISAGQSHSVAGLPDGTLWAWGGNSDGQIGIGTTSLSRVPLEVTR